MLRYTIHTERITGTPCTRCTMTTAKKPMTADELLHLPDDNLRHELVRGELTTMPLNDWDHGGAVSFIHPHICTWEISCVSRRSAVAH